jgi:acyl carrier protein
MPPTASPVCATSCSAVRPSIRSPWAGPTETTTFATTHAIETVTGESIPIGRPLANKRAYVLDASMRPVPVGVPGELYIGGVGVARGYLGRGALSAERFVADPFDPAGGRLYRTGDRAAWRPEGVIDFLGRVDEQVKVRGHRIEPAEIEAVLAAHPGIAAAVVVARDDGAGPRLVAYVVPADLSLGAPPTDQLRRFLDRSLPAYMVPGVYVELASLPLNPNGKVDRPALPAPEGGRPLLGAEPAAPTSPTEEVLVGVWGEVLAVEGVGVEDDFFDLGGHSLLATQVISRVRELFGVEVALAELFDHRTVAELAAVVEDHVIRDIEELSDEDAQRLLDGAAADAAPSAHDDDFDENRAGEARRPGESEDQP